MQRGGSGIPPVRVWTRDEMLKRVARFGDLKGFSDGLQDSMLPECQKTTYNVIGFQTPETAGQGSVNSPVGKTASENAAIRISEGFNLGFVKCRPGKGVLMHNHDTNETFVVMSGRWLVQWNEGPDTESLESAASTASRSRPAARGGSRTSPAASPTPSTCCCSSSAATRRRTSSRALDGARRGVRADGR